MIEEGTPDLVQQLLLWGLAVPAVWALVAWAIVLVTARGEKATGRSWMAAVAFAGAASIVQWKILAWPDIPPTESFGWIPWLILGGAVLGLFEGAWPKGWWLHGLLKVAAAGALAPLLLNGPIVEYEWRDELGWSDDEVRNRFVLLGGLAAAFWIGLDWMARVNRGRWGTLGLGLIVGASSGVLMHNENAKLAQLVGGLGAAIGVTYLMSLWRPQLSLVRGGVAVAGAGLLACFIGGYHFAYNRQEWPYLILVGSPWVMLIAGWLLQKRQGIGWAIARLVLFLAPCVGALVWAVINAPEPSGY
ncbi:MAG: hypothetical protein RL885_30885 [Planctomycetota bacterium]